MTQLIDNANRADGALGDPWQNVVAAHVVASNTFRSQDLVTTTISRINPSLFSFGNRQRANVNIAGPTSGSYVGVAARVQGVSPFGCYTFVSDGSTSLARIWRRNPTSGSTQLSDTTPYADGDQFGIEAVDDNGDVRVIAYINGIEVLSVLDPLNAFTAGQPGIYSYRATGNVSLDNFSATDEFGLVAAMPAAQLVLSPQGFAVDLTANIVSGVPAAQLILSPQGFAVTLTQDIVADVPPALIILAPQVFDVLLAGDITAIIPPAQLILSPRTFNALIQGQAVPVARIAGAWRRPAMQLLRARHYSITARPTA